MPNALTEENNDVAQLIYQVGVSTQTSFSTFYTETFSSFVRDALVQFFKYDEAAEWFYDSGQFFADAAIDDLNQGYPVLLTGNAPNNGGGHAWVADGYGFFLDPDPNMPDAFFHFIWGWGGDNNGWFYDTGATWAPVPGEEGTNVITFYQDRFVIHNIFPDEDECSAPTNTRNALPIYYANSVTDNTVYLNYFEPSLQDEEETQFRYRVVGAPQWTETQVTTDFFLWTPGLEAGTDYEFQVRRKCCGDIWSDWSVSDSFTTTGQADGGSACDNFINSNLSTSNIAQNNAYIYTSQPYGQVVNQFRYRFVGASLWTFSDLSVSNVRFISGLEEGTDYEFQVRHRCDQTNWSEFSESQFFTTQGSQGCQELEVDLFTSSVTTSTGYIYTTQPYGRVNNQFRYRAIGAADWQSTAVTTSYYRFLTGLEAGTEYEFQVAHQCDANAWTEWSASRTLTTTGGGSASCEAIDGDRLYNSSISRDAAYMYTPQPYGNAVSYTHLTLPTTPYV